MRGSSTAVCNSFAERPSFDGGKATTLQEIQTLCSYNRWANQRTIDCCRALSPEQFTRDLGSSFPSVRDTLVHIMLAEWIWHERCHGASPAKFQPGSDFPTLEAVLARWESIDLRGYAASLSGNDLERIVHFRRFDSRAHASVLWQILQHVVNHGTYHRGQVTTMLRQLGAKGISTDLIGFYREHAASTGS
jgi:uncharacterized damage-inducible protein DinB